MKPNEENSSSREIHQEVHTDASNGHVSTTRTTTSVPSTTAKASKEAAHHQGYVQGEMAENHRQVGVQEVRDNENAGRGLLLGILLASLAGLVLGSVYYFNRGEEAPTPTAAPVIVVPKANQPSATPAPTRTIEREKTIIEKIVPVQPSPVQKATPAPQPSPAQKAAPAPQQSPAPNINITIPNSQQQDAPAQQAAPSPSSRSNNTNTTVPNSQNEPATTPPTPAPESSATPSPTPDDGASGSGTSGETNTQSQTDSNSTGTAVPNSNPGAEGAPGSQP
ncbi:MULTISPECIES: hypothetical protein [unclassified Microcoleus]|uniref:hypothetical protein n=1 Tax=unclassified Microcoleus TaxID=2642155 RepID=UPI002FD4AA89